MDLNLFLNMKVRRYQREAQCLKEFIYSVKWLWLIFIGTLFLLIGGTSGPGKISIAVINLETSSNLSNKVGEDISEHLRTHLAHLYTFDVMDKDRMNDIINTQGFLRPKGCKKIECHPSLFETQGTLRFLQKCGASDNDAALEIGWMLGVEKILIGFSSYFTYSSLDNAAMTKAERCTFNSFRRVEFDKLFCLIK